MKTCAFVAGLVLMSAQVTMVELPDVGDLPDDLQLISVASGDWRGKHVDGLIATLGDPTRTIGIKGGGRRLIYRVPLHQGWTLTGDSPTLQELNERIVSDYGNAGDSTMEPVMLPGSGTERPVVIGRLLLVFETSKNDRVIDVTIEQKFKKKYRNRTANLTE